MTKIEELLLLRLEIATLGTEKFARNNSAGMYILSAL